MNFRHPLIIVSVAAILITALCVSAILASYSAEQLRSEKRAQVLELREAARGLVSTVNQSLMKTIVGVYERELAAPESTASLEASEFTAIGSFSQDTSNRWVDDWFVSRSPQVERGWFAKIERQIQIGEVKPGELTWVRLISENEQVLFAVLTRVQVKTGDILKTKIVIAISSQALLSPINLVSKGNPTQIFAVDREGYTYSYPEAQYVGAKIDTHPVVKALISTDVGPEVSEYVNLDGAAIFGASEWVPDSNLAVIVTAPKVSTRHLLAQFFTHAMIIVMALIALVSVGLALLMARDGRERSVLLRNLELLQKPKDDKTTANENSIGVVPGASLHSATHLAVKEIVKAIADYMRMPLTAVLGQLQIADHQDSVVAIKETVGPTVADVRRMRDFVESLCAEVQLPDVKREVVDVLPVINQVIAAQKGLCSKFDINIEENFRTDFAIRADFERVKSSIQALVLFGIEFLGAAPLSDVRTTRTVGELNEKRIIIHIEKLAGLGQIQIECRGRELSSDTKRQFFMPFKTKLNMGTQFGLDLVVAQARIEEMQGEVFIENSGANCFRIVARFATALKVTADQLLPLKESTVSYPSIKETFVEDPLESKKVSEAEQQTLPPAPKITFNVAPEDDILIRKPKLRLDL